MKTRSYLDASNNTRLVLLAPWAGLTRGTELRPLAGGYSNELGGTYAEVTVLTGERAGERVKALT